MPEPNVQNRLVSFQDLGRINYKEAWDYQQKLLDQIVSIKVENRKNQEIRHTPNYLLFCEHPAVYSIGKSGDLNNLLITEQQMKEKDIEFYRTNRGGDITFHGPEQIVGYPILDLENFETDIHKYLRDIEEVIIRTLSDYGIPSGRVEGLTGVWIDEDSQNPRKICAIGVRTSRWVTMHGFALNVNTDLNYFNKIIPCGIEDKEVTSMEKELKLKVDTESVKRSIRKKFAEVFEMHLSEK